MKSNLVEALIGAVVLAVAGVFFWYTYSTTDAGTVDGYRLTARFDSVGALNVGADVRMSGIKVGSIVGQRLDGDSYQAVVEFTVRDTIKLPTDSSAKITSEGLLGDTYMALQPGGMPEYLQNGDQIEFTQGAVDLFSLIGQAVFSAGNDSDGDNSQ